MDFRVYGTDLEIRPNPGALSSAWSCADFLHGAVFALCVMIISKSRTTERISSVGKLALLFGVISYIANFYVRIEL